MRLYVFILGFSALFIAGCAAFFSVSGIASLFTGAFWAVAIMAGALEIGKLVAASYLHRYWYETSWFLKTYLSIGVLALMIITSAGIFGFLTSAYQESAAELENQNSQIEVFENRKSLIQDQLDNYKSQRQELITIRSQQTTRLDSLYQREWYQSARRTEERIDEIDTRIESLSGNITAATDSIGSIDNRILEIKSNSEVSKEIGPLLYVSREFNTDIDTAVKFFTFLLIFVFDPMAVSLVIAYNVALERSRKESKSVDDNDNGSDNDDGGGNLNPKNTPDDSNDGPKLVNELENQGSVNDSYKDSIHITKENSPETENQKTELESVFSVHEVRDEVNKDDQENHVTEDVELEEDYEDGETVVQEDEYKVPEVEVEELKYSDDKEELIQEIESLNSIEENKYSDDEIDEIIQVLEDKKVNKKEDSKAESNPNQKNNSEDKKVKSTKRVDFHGGRKVGE